MSKDTRERLSLRVSSVTSYRLRTIYKKSGCRSMNELAEQAINFYLDYLSANDAGLFLPASIKSYVDGRLGKMEDRLSALSFKQVVELDMLSGIIADSVQLDEDDLRRRRGESVKNVKRTNGCISFEQRVWKSRENGDTWQG